MESSSLVRKKREKDRLNDLPEAVFLHLLSFMDMKEVVERSLVCKKWRYIWKSVPRLNFCHSMWTVPRLSVDRPPWKNNTDYKLNFMNFVDRVLLLHDDSVITRLELSCHDFCDADRIDTWMTVAAKRRVKEIYVKWKFGKKRARYLPPFIFHSDLTVFSLQSYPLCPYIPYHPHLKMPVTMCLAPMLKTLYLSNVKLPQGKGELYLTCPILENLTLVHCEHENLNALNIHTTQLRNLVMVNKDHCDNSSCKIEICCSKLESLELSGSLYNQYSMKNLVSLQTARFEFPYNCKVPANFILGVNTVRSLEVGNWSMEPPGYVMEELANPFTNLKCLKLARLSFSSIYAILKLLSTSHEMESLEIEASKESKNSEWEYMLLPSMFPNLKDVTVWTYQCYENELISFLKHLLKNAVVLQKLTIKVGSDCTIGPKEFEEKIHSLPRASSSITVHLHLHLQGSFHSVKFGLA